MSKILTRQEIRRRTVELSELLCEWDPICLASGFRAPRDAYDSLLGPLLTLLASGAAESEVADHLCNKFLEQFGYAAEPHEFLDGARRIRGWFERYWSKPGMVETIMVALLDEGLEVWRPVQARAIGADLYRILGVEMDVRDERWEFSRGAVVRCKPKEFEGGDVRMTAFELAPLAG